MTTRLVQDQTVLLDRYEIVEYINEGGMQQVYKALDRSFDRFVALKVPKNNSASKRFDRSAKLSAKVTHSNLAKTLDYFEVSGNSFLVEELIPGKDLEKCLAQDYVVLDPHLVAQVCHRIVRGLAAAHHAKIFHRDLKPSNIMVSLESNSELVKITDFGIARMAAAELREAAEQGVESLTSNQTALGTLPYMSPEMINSSKEAGLPSDIWAAGAIMYRLLTGEFPFGTGLKAVTAIVMQPFAKPVEPPAGSNFLRLWRDIWEIIVPCLAKEAGDRPTADELLSMFSQLCYSDAERMTGIVTSVRPKNFHWGYIRGDDGMEVFYHEDNVYGPQPKVGTRVQYALSSGEPSPRAFPVICMKPATN